MIPLKNTQDVLWQTFFIHKRSKELYRAITLTFCPLSPQCCYFFQHTLVYYRKNFKRDLNVDKYMIKLCVKLHPGSVDLLNSQNKI